MIPNPKERRQIRKMTLHIHEGISVASPNPPQTPPITLSLDDLLAFFKFSHVVINASDGFCCFPSEAVECVFLNYPSAGWPSIFLLPSTLIINTGKGIAFDQGVGSIRTNPADSPGFFKTTNNQHHPHYSYNKLCEIARQEKNNFA